MSTLDPAPKKVAVIGAGSLFGFTRLSRVLTLVEPDIRGRLLVFFPGQYEDNTYRLLDARDGRLLSERAVHDAAGVAASARAIAVSAYDGTLAETTSPVNWDQHLLRLPD